MMNQSLVGVADSYTWTWESCNWTVVWGLVRPLSLFRHTIFFYDIKWKISITSSTVAGVIAWSENVGALKNKLFWKIFFCLSLDHHEGFIKSNGGECPAGTAAALVLYGTGLGSPVWRNTNFEAELNRWDFGGGSSLALRSFGTEELYEK